MIFSDLVKYLLNSDCCSEACGGTANDTKQQKHSRTSFNMQIVLFSRHLCSRLDAQKDNHHTHAKRTIIRKSQKQTLNMNLWCRAEKQLVSIFHAMRNLLGKYFAPLKVGHVVTGYVMRYCMAIHFLCSCEWQCSCGDDKVFCSSQFWSCANVDSVMHAVV